MKDKLIIICGATAVGKSSVAVELAQKINGEIISADSMQIYKKLNLGTAKISEREMFNIKHNLIDFLEPVESFDVSEYVSKAENVIKEIVSRGKTPIVVGGTGLYIESLIYKYSLGQGFDDNVRKDYENFRLENGNEALHNLLKEIDAIEAEKIHFNNHRRVIRALEIYKLTGKIKSELADKKLKYDVIMFNLIDDRESLYSRINERVDTMIDNGLVNEVIALINDGISFENQCMQGIGYKEFKNYIMGNDCLENVVEQIKLNSRHYAKRQLTWFNRYKFKIDININNSKLDRILEHIEVDK